VRRTLHSRQPRSARYRPQLLFLEDRLPPGDTVLGGLLGWSWLGTGLAVVDPSLSALERNVNAEPPVIHRPRHDNGGTVPARQGTFVRVEFSASDCLPTKQATGTSAVAGAVSVWNTPDDPLQDWDPGSAFATRNRELPRLGLGQLDGGISGTTGQVPFFTGSLVYGISSSTQTGEGDSRAEPRGPGRVNSRPPAVPGALRAADQVMWATPSPTIPKESQRSSNAQGGELSFADPVDYTTGRSPRSVAAGDFRGIGIQDLAVANAGSNDLSIFLGNGDGSFRLAATVVVGTNPYYVTTGHFHDSGILDLAVVDSGSNAISILLGHGDGSFGLPHSYSVGRNPQSIAVGEFHAAGIQDLAVANRDSNNVSILLGNGDGTFSPASNIAVGGAATFVVAADFAGDGRQDLAVTTVDSSFYLRGTLSILLGNGDGTFSSGQNLTGVGRNLTSIAVHDFNRDGTPDLAVTGYYTATVSILLGNGDGTFTLNRNYQVGGQPLSIAVADFDGDGIPDIATVGLQSSSVLVGNGDGTFQTTQYFWGGANPFSVAVSDFNRDGRDDLAIVQNFTNQVSVLLNNSPQPPDGVTVFRDIIYYDGQYSNPQRENLDVYVPPHRTDFPVVFFAFGGQYRNQEKSSNAYLARALAREGLGFVAINYRITDGSSQQVVFPAHEVDVARAFKWTYNHIADYGGNPQKIVLMGHSAGGGLVSLLATDHSYLAAQGLSPDVIKGVIGVSGGFYDVRRSDSPLVNGPFNDVFGDLEQQWNASPLKYVDGTQPPFLLLYASNDNPGFPEDATTFYEALVTAGSSAEIHMIPGRTHQMIMPSVARPGDPAREYILDFIADHTG